MNILFITPPPYLPNRLHRNRSFDLIRILAKNHKIHLLSVVTDKKVYPDFKEIRKACESVKVVRISKFCAFANCIRFFYLPLEVAYCYSQKAKKEIEKIVENKKIDLVYVKRLRSVIFMPEVSVPTVVDTTDAMSLFYERMSKSYNFPKNIFYQLESAKYKWYEKKVAHKFKNWIVSSPVDEKYLLNLKLDINTFVVPNAVDTKYFSPLRVHSKTVILRSMTEESNKILRGVYGEFIEFSQDDRKRFVERNSILFSGLMDKPVNVDAAVFFVKKVFSLVKKEISDAKLYIVGPKPNSKIRQLASSDVIITGYAIDIRTLINRAQVVVAPVRVATGTRFKILQAWAMGKPVVSTTIGAEGLKARDGENILIADSPKKFAQKVVSLFNNRRLYNKISRNGRKTVEKEYSMQSISQKLQEVLRNVNKSKSYIQQ